MDQVVVKAFGGVEQLQVIQGPDPTPGPEDVVVRLTSIGMNHADLMARRGEYRLTSGNPPFTPGLEGGGVIVAVGSAVQDRAVGQRVILTLEAPKLRGLGQGTYQSHYTVPAAHTLLAPPQLESALLGALWLPYLTAWGCLMWQQNLQPGQWVLIPAASSSVAIAAAQVVKQSGAIAVGTTRDRAKLERLQALPDACFDHLICTDTDDWWRQAKQLTAGRGFDVIFDPVAAGTFLHQEIRLLAPGGTLWIYGLLGQPDVVDVTPLIRKMAALRGWLVNALVTGGMAASAYTHVLERVVDGTYRLPVAGTFSLRDVQQAHITMEKGDHIGKLILIPD
jgi:NADPH2:quinone reductase